MKKWNKPEAIQVINELIDAIQNVVNSGRKSEEHMRWLANTLRIIEEVFGAKSRYYATIANFSWSFQGTCIRSTWDSPEHVQYEINKQAFKEQMLQAKGLLDAAVDHLQSSSIEDVFEDSKHQETGDLFRIISLSTTKLRKLIREKPDKEKEVQDKYADLLMVQDIEYSREFPHIEYSSKQYVPDFCFEKIDLVVEIKLCKNDEKTLIAQINDDILAYKTKFQNILFIIYDLGQIRDEDLFKSSFESHSNVIVQIIKH